METFDISLGRLQRMRPSDIRQIEAHLLKDEFKQYLKGILAEYLISLKDPRALELDDVTRIVLQLDLAGFWAVVDAKQFFDQLSKEIDFRVSNVARDALGLERLVVAAAAPTPKVQTEIERNSSLREAVETQLRLERSGSKKSPFYHIIAAEKGKKGRKRRTQVLGSYRPQGIDKREQVDVDFQRVNNLLERGAQPSDRLIKVLVGAGMVVYTGRVEATKATISKRYRSKSGAWSSSFVQRIEPAKREQKVVPSGPIEASQVSGEKKSP